MQLCLSVQYFVLALAYLLGMTYKQYTTMQPTKLLGHLNRQIYKLLVVSFMKETNRNQSFIVAPTNTRRMHECKTLE